MIMLVVEAVLVVAMTTWWWSWSWRLVRENEDDHDAEDENDGIDDVVIDEYDDDEMMAWRICCNYTYKYKYNQLFRLNSWLTKGLHNIITVNSILEKLNKLIVVNICWTAYLYLLILFRFHMQWATVMSHLWLMMTAPHAGLGFVMFGTSAALKYP